MLLLVIQSAFRPSKPNKHHVLFDRMLSDFLVLDFFPGQVSSFVGHKVAIASEMTPWALLLLCFSPSWSLFLLLILAFVTLQKHKLGTI